MDAETSERFSTQVITESESRRKPRQPKAPLGIRIGAVAAPLLSFFARHWITIAMALAGQKIHAVELAQMAGTLIGVVLFPAVVVLLFQIGKRFRTPRKRWAIYFYVSLFLLAGNLFSAFSVG